MAQKDLASKLLESEPDVFADIFNALLFDTEETKITDAESTLFDEATEGFYHDSSGSLRNMFQDIAKSYRKGNMESNLVCLNIENESMIKRTALVKCLGYKFAALKRQQDAYESKRKALLEVKNRAKKKGDMDTVKVIDEELDELGEFSTIPFISIVLNFDDRKWNEPTDLSELNIDSPYSEFDQPYKIRVFNVKHLTAEERARFKSDFRIFLEIFCTDSLPEELKDIPLRHPTKLADMIIAFSNNQNFINIRKKIAIDELEGKETKMGELFDRIAEEAKAEAEARADAEKARADALEKKNEELRAKLLASGISPD